MSLQKHKSREEWQTIRTHQKANIIPIELLYHGHVMLKSACYMEGHFTFLHGALNRRTVMNFAEHADKVFSRLWYAVDISDGFHQINVLKRNLWNPQRTAHMTPRSIITSREKKNAISKHIIYLKDKDGEWPTLQVSLHHLYSGRVHIVQLNALPSHRVDSAKDRLVDLGYHSRPDAHTRYIFRKRPARCRLHRCTRESHSKRRNILTDKYHT